MAMRKKKISETLGYIHEKYVEEAFDYPEKNQVKKRRGLKRWMPVAVCACGVFMAGVLLFPALWGSDTRKVNLGGVTRIYKNMSIVENEAAIIWPWEYQTLTEQFSSLLFEGKDYSIRGKGIGQALLGNELGNYEAVGYDHYTEQEYRQEFQVREIQGISRELMVAVNMNEEYYVFARNEYAPPATFGELLEGYDLVNTLEFSRFTKYEGHDTEGHFQVEDDDAIWEILSACKDARFIEDDTWSRSERDYLSFTATSESLGVYRRVVYITADGYFSTNVFDYSYKYFIGEEAAGQIISYALENCKEGAVEPYTSVLAGTIVEVTDDYMLVDDGILCKKQSDGMVFKLSMKDIRIRRFVEFLGARVGDTVSVQFTGEVDVEAGNLVQDVYDIATAHISEGEVWVEE